MDTDKKTIARIRKVEIFHRDVLTKLKEAQKELRFALLDELSESEEVLDASSFDAEGYNTFYEKLRYRFADRLDLIRRIIHEINVLDKNQKEYRVEMIEADDLAGLQPQLARFFKELPANVGILDIHIERGQESHQALISYFQWTNSV